MFVPYKTQRGKVSRQVELDRVRRDYDQISLEAELNQTGLLPPNVFLDPLFYSSLNGFLESAMH